jgi:hypothetical protein
MATSARHLESMEYADLAEALVDAERVATDLLAVLDGQLVVLAEHVEFLARRLRVLVRSCSAAIPPAVT